jgi:hypothetical protein
MESACDCDLELFFDQWLDQGGNIVIDGTWAYDDEEIEIVLHQVQNGGFDFTVDVEIGVLAEDNSLPEIHHVVLGPDGGRVSIPAARRPAKVVIDPRTVLLARWTFDEVEK